MSNIEVFYLHYSKFNIRCSIFFHASFLNLTTLAVGTKPLRGARNLFGHSENMAFVKCNLKFFRELVIFL
jgi:hypothetical protein